jgi:transketolase
MKLKGIAQLEKKARQIRQLVLEMCVRAKTGHVTSSFSSVEIIVALYYAEILRYRASAPSWPGRDRFILSKGQASPLLYAVLADRGFFPKAKLKKFCQKDGIFGVHLQNDIPGVEITSGSLGYGLGIAAGMALAAKKDNKQHLTFALLGDGECHEGSIWESAMFAAHHRLNNLIAIIDRNQLCVTGATEEIVALNPLQQKWLSFGWEVATINGHSFPQLLAALKKSSAQTRARPYCIIANTIKGKGISFMENQPLWHGRAPQGKEARLAKKELNRKVAL